jgi:hypothetical protein
MRRQFGVRAISTLTAVLLAAGTCGAVIASVEAGANTPSYTTTCPETPLGTLSSSVITTGTLPSTVKVKKPFTLSNSAFRLTITNPRLLHLAEGFTLGGKVVTALATKGALPAAQAVTYTLKPVKIPSPAPKSLTFTAKGSTTTFTAPKAGKVTVWTTGSAKTTLTFIGATAGPYACNSRPASLQIAKTVAAS